jgi:hypothetical protein
MISLYTQVVQTPGSAGPPPLIFAIHPAIGGRVSLAEDLRIEGPIEPASLATPDERDDCSGRVGLLHVTDPASGRSTDTSSSLAWTELFARPGVHRMRAQAASQTTAIRAQKTQTTHNDQTKCWLPEKATFSACRTQAGVCG